MEEIQGPESTTTENLTKRISSLIDDLTIAVKEIVNVGGETALHLAVGSGRIFTAVVNAAGEVAKIGVETTGNVVETVAGGVNRVMGSKEEKSSQNSSETNDIEIL
ncbi:MAG: hypothetical protein NZ770_05970 [Candidatus Poseidoniaceae archaeon]|nr:hypothetical protein [Candidatus Poseidoniaceae archaeon]